jgi:hypothetical protein
MLARTSLACRLARGHRPVIAVLDTGMGLTASLPAGTHVVAAKSFVGADPWEDRTGSGSRIAAAVAQSVAGRWTPAGPSEVALVIVQVATDGRPTREALAAAARWLADTDLVIDAVALRDATAAEEEEPWSRRLARDGIRLHGRFLPSDASRVAEAHALAA